jgi:hypothetical protein
MNNKEMYWAIDDDRFASYGTEHHGFFAVDDRFGDNFGDWQATAVNPRTIDSEDETGAVDDGHR